MLCYDEFRLENGLRVVVHGVVGGGSVVFNMMYGVGSGDELVGGTGLAHLFEHLMFSGSEHVVDYDRALEEVGGVNNAYTTFDVTSYYCVLPVGNLETAFWLESDRMYYLRVDGGALDVQRGVVIEEFREMCYGRPYGDVWHHLLDLAYVGHGYAWPTIGRGVGDIEGLSLGDVRGFGDRYYRPCNAVLVVAGGVGVDEVRGLSEKWFGGGGGVGGGGVVGLGGGFVDGNRRRGVYGCVVGDVPFNVLYRGYHIPGRGDVGYLSFLVLAHLLGTGRSSLLYRRLVDDLGLVTDVSVYTMDMLGGGLFVIECEMLDGVWFEEVEDVIDGVVADVCGGVGDDLFVRARNQVESDYFFGHMSLLDRADSLAWSTWLGSPSFFGDECGGRLGVLGVDEVCDLGRRFLVRGDAVRLHYCKR